MTLLNEIKTKDSTKVRVHPPKHRVSDALSVLVGPSMPLDPTSTIPQLIALQAKTNPTGVAAKFGKENITYAQLDVQSELLAATLLQQAQKTHAKFAALVLPNGLELILALTATMRAGLPFVPIDPDWPTDRLSTVIGALEKPLLISTKTALPEFDAPYQTILLPLETQNTSNSIVLPNVLQDDLIYGFFTSGTTGTPKCALNLHKGLLNRVSVMTDRFGDPKKHVVLQNSKQVFDSSMWQILWPLAGGGTVVVPKRAAVFELDEVLNIIADHGVTMSDFVPSVFNLMVDRIERDPKAFEKIKSLKTLLLGGEEVNPRACARFKALMPHVQLINTYGPTEASIGSVFHEITGKEVMNVPIGKPIANTIAAVMDEAGNPVSFDTPGEIYVGGTCLGAGYLNNPEKTKASLAYIDQPQIPASVMYKTGDIGKLSPEGHLVYLGRQDFQVKINGIRIELTEIEGALTSHPEVKEAKAVAISLPNGGKRIVAFYTGTELDPTVLRTWLQDILPKGHRPSKLVYLNKMPRTPNAKIDRKLLVQQAGALFKVAKGNVSRTLCETSLKNLWRSQLGVPEIDGTSDFFKLGGDSLMALAVCMEMDERFSISINSSDLYDHAQFDEFLAFVTDPNRGDGAHNRRDKDTSKARQDAAASSMIANIQTRDDQTPKGILVLGPTGFIGAHVLAHLTEKLTIPVTVVVRAADDATAKKRLRQTLQTYRLHRPGILDRVNVLAGDLGRAGMGVSSEAIAAIEQDTDVIVNCAAKVDFLAGYDGHRRVNTKLIQGLVDLCNTGRPKILQHLSSFAAMPKPDKDVISDKDPVSQTHLPSEGYGLSKWAAEGVLDGAIQQGVSANIIRLGEIGASRTTGAGNQTAMLTYLLRACLELGTYPSDVAAFDYTSVDCVAAMITELVMEPGTQGRRFHLLQPTSVTMHDFGQAAASVGLEMEPISYAKFFAAVSNAVGSGTASDAVKRLAALLPEPTGTSKEQIVLSDCTQRCSTSFGIMSSSQIAEDTIGFREKALGRFLQSLATS
ncbi:MAG: amino acid adenylation domain-containing protein [Paracoccaceae bacterium]